MASKQNIIYVYFKGKHLTISKSQYQYNHGQFLYFADLDLPQAFEVHFSNKDKGESKTQIGSDNLVEIPDEYFWNGALQIYAWIYLHSGADDGETVYEVKIPLMKRAKPTDEEPLPQQQGVIDRAIAELNNAIEITTENANKTNADKTIVNNIKDEVVVLKDEIDSTATTINQKAQEAIAASERAETSAQNAGTSERKALDYAQQADQSAQSALESKNVAQQKAEVATNASSEALGYKNEALEAKNQAVQAKQNIVDYRDETKGYRDETLNLKNTVQTLKNQADETAEEIKDISDTVKEDAQSASQSASSASQSSTNASQFASQAKKSADDAEELANQVEQNKNQTETFKNQSEEYKTQAETFKTQTETFKNQAEEFKNQTETNVTHYPKIIGEYWYIWDATNGEYINTNVDANGIKGDTGNGIASVALNDDYTLTITFTDGTTYTTPSIRGEKGEKGDPATSMDIHICSSSEYDNETRIPTITSPDDKTFYLVPTEDGTSPDLFTEWVYVNNAWEMFGSASVDLSGYLTDVQVNGTSVVTDGVANITNLKYVKDDPSDNGGVIEGHISANSASGAYSHSEGDGTTASAPCSHAEGYQTTASSTCSHAEGRETTANALYAHAEGYQTTVTSMCGHAEGTGNTVSGDSAHAEGNNTTASERWAHAEGGGTTASGECSHSEGAGTRATGNQAHSEGGGTLASGNQAHAEGASTTASGDNSHAENLSTIASGACSHASGVATIAQRKSQMTIGEYNVADTGGSTTSDKGDYILIAGNGTANSNRSNAMTLDWSGNEKLGGSLTLGMNTQDETTISASELKGLKEMSPVEDVQINSTSIVQDGVAEIPIGGNDTFGVFKLHTTSGLTVQDGTLKVQKADSNMIKVATNNTQSIVPVNQHMSTFYGLAKSAGDTTQSASSNAVGNYTNEAKTSIQNMLGITDKYTPKEWIAESETELVTNAHNIGDLFYIGETLYKVIADLNAGDAVNVGVNVEEVNIDDILDDYATKEDVQDNISIVEKSTSGSIASFPDGADDIPLKSLVVGINPVQDLHGYDSPWVAGGGKNLFDQENVTVTNSGIVTLAKPIPAGTYTMSALVTSTDTDTNYNRVNIWDENNTMLAAFSLTRDTRASNTFTIESVCAKVVFYASSTAANSADDTATFSKVQIEAGSTATAWTPYENICPISGWTGVDVEQSGANVWDEEWEVGGIDPTNGRNNEHTNRLRSKNYIPCRPSATYWFKKADDAQSYRTVYYDKEQTFIESSNSMSASAEFTTPDNCYFVRFFSMNPVYSGDISINYPSTDHDYHPYTGRSIPISWQTEAGTVYGGKLDVLSGVLTITHQTKTFDGTEAWSQTSAGKFYVNQSLTDFDVQDSGWISSKYPYSGYMPFSNYMGIDNSFYTNYNGGSSTKERIFVLGFSFADAASFQASLATTPLTVCGKLKEPIEIQLTPAEVRALLGQNNIFADTGDASIEYFSQVDEDLTDYIEANLNSYAKKDLLNNYVDDIQINGTSIVENGIAEIPFATSNAGGVVKIDSSLGIKLNDTNKLLINRATTTQAKAGSDAARPIVPICQHESVFYGLTKAAGVDMASSSNAVGTYTESAKSAISDMLNGAVQISGTDPTINAMSGIRYVCGEVLSLNFTPSANGICDVMFTSGSTPTVLTLPNTVKMPEWFIIEANTTYEINIADGIYGAVTSWTL